HDPVKVVSLAGRTIQDAEMFEQLVDHRHLSQTPDVGFPPSDRIFLSSISDKSAEIAYEFLDEWDDRVRTSASSVAFTDSSIR
nr:hypothetical protein [Tanacetum cinerariifolium]